CSSLDSHGICCKSDRGCDHPAFAFCYIWWLLLHWDDVDGLFNSCSAEIERSSDLCPDVEWYIWCDCRCVGWLDVSGAWSKIDVYHYKCRRIYRCDWVSVVVAGYAKG